MKGSDSPASSAAAPAASRKNCDQFWRDCAVVDCLIAAAISDSQTVHAAIKVKGLRLFAKYPGGGRIPGPDKASPE